MHVLKLATLLSVCVVVAAGTTASGSWAEDAVAVPAAPEDGGPRRWQVDAGGGSLNLRAEASMQGKVLELLATGTVLANLGCLQAESMVWCQVQPVGGGAVGFASAEHLVPALGPDGSVATGYDDSAYRAGQGDFDAKGSIACSFDGAAPTRCEFGVSRAGGGDATIVVTRPDGRTRAIFFTAGSATGADSSEADAGSWDFNAERQDDTSIIRVGRERYEVPDAAVLGG